MLRASTKRDQILGCLLGGVLGDAWGGPWEGRTGPVVFNVPLTSRLSDDTQLTLATCESIVECGRVDAERVAATFVKWFKAGRITGAGASTVKAMRDLGEGVHWALAGNRGEFAAGNGAAMRIAPVAFLLDHAKKEDRTLIRDICRITHHNEEAYVGALAIVVAVRSVLEGNWSDGHSFLSLTSAALPDSAVRDRIEEIRCSELPPAEIATRFGTTGYVVDTVPIALYFSQLIAKEPVTSVLTQAIRAGGDTDTIASITGQIAGTVVGATELPSDAFRTIAGGDEAIRVSGKFADFVSR